MFKHYDGWVRSCLILMATCVLPTLVMAAGTEIHVLGIVAAIGEKHIDVKTAKGPTVSVLLNKQVKFKNKSNPKSNEAPIVGDRVIIEATKDDKTKKMSATVVHYSSVKTALSP
ncbi:MAG: hypothetical protein OJF51_001621 [Nitrospira sp.]|jgi:hypothetical protein|nr:MAG: hypothetical protein OJF51_001621 [Nitrospira sp.]